jgi:outer membrane immunogenic protein
MKRPMLASVALLTATAAIAADVPPQLPPPRAPVFVPFLSWNGFYMGINGGYGWGNSNWTDNVTGATTGDFDVSGGQFGVTFGYNMQTLGSWIFGLETDLDWSDISGSANPALCAGDCSTKNTWMGTTRVRLGHVWDRVLPYVTGGLSYGGIKIANGASSVSSTQIGWVAGFGIEWAFMNQWTVKLEYLYVDLDDTTCDATCSGGNPFDVKFNTGILRAGVNYRF